MPVIGDTRAVNNLTVQSGATLTITGVNARLNIFGSITNNGTITNTTGYVGLFGNVAQTLPAGVYSKIEINNPIGVTLSGNITITDSIIFTDGIVSLQNNILTLGNNAYASSGSASSYIRNDGTGNVVVNNVGVGGKTGNVIIPIGNTSFNPVVLNNLGVVDDYTVWVIDSVVDNYSGSTPIGSAITSNVVNRTWIINELVPGGSNATVILQWNAANETTGFSRSNAYISRYTGTNWNSTAATSASGSNPYTLSRSGITSFSPFGVASGGVLPVKLLSFTATKMKRNVDVNWITASEKNSSYFLVERSSDGMIFETISAKIKATGYSSSLQSYDFTDVNAAEFADQSGGTIYYRLKQVDLDGSFDYSDLAVVVFEENNEVFTSALPNPFADKLTVLVSNQTSGLAEVKLTDAMGKVVQSVSVYCNAGDNEIEIPKVDQLYGGVYFISIVLNDKTYVHKLVRR